MNVVWLDRASLLVVRAFVQSGVVVCGGAIVLASSLSEMLWMSWKVVFFTLTANSHAIDGRLFVHSWMHRVLL